MRRRSSPVVRLYGALARLLPPDMDRERTEMSTAFAEQWADEEHSTRRAGNTIRSLAALVAVVVVEWVEFLGARPAPGRTDRKTRRGRMALGTKDGILRQQ